jgi:hypothetical protein
LPKTEKEIHNGFENYINQMMTSARNWSISDFDKNKTYEHNGVKYKGVLKQYKQTFKMDFFPLDKSTSETDKKPWWKVW